MSYQEETLSKTKGTLEGLGLLALEPSGVRPNELEKVTRAKKVWVSLL